MTRMRKGIVILAIAVVAFVGFGGSDARADHASCIAGCLGAYNQAVQTLTATYEEQTAICALTCFLDGPACVLCEAGALAIYETQLYDAGETAQTCEDGCPPDPTPPPAE